VRRFGGHSEIKNIAPDGYAKKAGKVSQISGKEISISRKMS